MDYFENQGPTPTLLGPEMEVKEFRIACGEFIGIGDVSRDELEKPGTALVPHGISFAKDMFAEGPGKFNVA
jgi:hypothetical protein